MWGLFIRKTPSWAALLSIGCGLTVSIIAFLKIPLANFGFPPDAEWTFQVKLFGVFGAGTLGFFLSIPFAPARDSAHRQKVDSFIKTMKTPIDFETEIGEGNDLAQLNLIGKFGISIAAFIALMLIIPNPLEGRLVIAVLALVIGIISTLMIKAGSKSARSGKAEY